MTSGRTAHQVIRNEKDVSSLLRSFEKKMKNSSERSLSILRQKAEK